MKFLPFLILVSCISRTELKVPTTEEKYEVLENIILDTTNNLFDYPLIFSDMSHLGPPMYGGAFTRERDYLMDLLDIQDSTYLLEQFNGRSTLDQAKFKTDEIRVLKISQMGIDNFWEFLDSDSIAGLYSVELPIFNEDRTKFYIRTGYICGSLCGSEQANLFEYDMASGNWRISEEFDVAIY